MSLSEIGAPCGPSSSLKNAFLHRVLSALARLARGDASELLAFRPVGLSPRFSIAAKLSSAAA